MKRRSLLGAEQRPRSLQRETKRETYRFAVISMLGEVRPCQMVVPYNRGIQDWRFGRFGVPFRRPFRFFFLYQ